MENNFQNNFNKRIFEKLETKIAIENFKEKEKHSYRSYTTIKIASILIIIGSYLLFKEYKLKSKEECKNPAGFYEIFILSINNSLAGLSASITGINYFFATIFNFIFSSIFLYIGAKIGKKVNNTKIEKYSNYLSAIIIIILGIIEWK